VFASPFATQIESPPAATALGDAPTGTCPRERPVSAPKIPTESVETPATAEPEPPRERTRQLRRPRPRRRRPRRPARQRVAAGRGATAVSHWPRPLQGAARLPALLEHRLEVPREASGRSTLSRVKGRSRARPRGGAGSAHIRARPPRGRRQRR